MTTARLAACLACTLLLPASSRAIDNSKHIFGLGAVTQFSSADPAVPVQLSAKLALQPRAEVSFLFGMAANTPTAFLPGLKFDFVLVPEQHMNFYAVLGLSLDLHATGGLQAVLYQAGAGMEFFFTEFPNVGFAFEFGFGGGVKAAGAVGVTTQGFATTATGVLGGAGVHYYF